MLDKADVDRNGLIDYQQFASSMVPGCTAELTGAGSQEKFGSVHEACAESSVIDINDLSVQHN